ncbi:MULTISPECIES: zinc transporter ZntB [unclassified Motilimonas]|uniref:zinc transporter ZntB n=1 Tax=Motilimonas TaxID=1914248 RepID=UPI001E3742E4|nr:MULTISPECIES: zinc transporter ZntB [unclassified Motilimonas]MCE0558077.1 zinc transporter ZntB [Motilimonas sp. E26]MDO6526082.1 zinc transporter ZntB [Motilimonas sp. 1_MG-2023]
MPINGLVHGLLLDGKGGATPVDTHQAITEWRPEDGKLWLHFDYTDAASRHWITQESGLSEHVVDALLAGETRPRVTGTNYGSASLIFLRGVNLNPTETPEDMVSIRLYVDDNRIISTRKRRLLSIDDIRKQLTQGDGPTCITEVISSLTERLTMRMQHVIDSLEQRIDNIEDELYQEEELTIGQEISSIRRQTITLKRYIAPQQAALSKLYESNYPWIDEAFRHEFKETANHLMRYVEELEVIVERAQIAYEERSDLLSEQLNQRMYVMSVVAAIFLPLGFLTGLLGINVGGIPGSENPAAFYIFIALLLALTGSLIGLFWWKKWL